MARRPHMARSVTCGVQVSPTRVDQAALYAQRTYSVCSLGPSGLDQVVSSVC